jgi:hypothetical protein
MRGIAADDRAEPHAFRIVGSRRTPAGLTVEGLLLDRFGNYLPPSRPDSADLWVAYSGCRGDAIISEIAPIVEERRWRTDAAPAAMMMLIDHSYTSNGLAEHVVRELGNLLPGVIGGDQIGITLFDHATYDLSSITSVQGAAMRCNADSLRTHQGLSGVHQAIMHGLRTLEGHPSTDRILILVTASNDMTSLAITSADIVERAIKAGVRIHVVKVGYQAHGYVFRAITASTGGRLYAVSDEDAGAAAAIARELLYARRQHLEIFLPLTMSDTKCDDLLFKVGLRTGDTLLADTIMLPLKHRAFRTSRAIVAAFKDTNEVGIQEFYPLLALIAEELMADPDRSLMLVGHVSTDVKSDHVASGLRRAGFIADFLKAYGVRAQQLHIRSEGSYSPRYYLQLDGTQRLLNNRVEAYYLLAEDEPFTITVAQFETETQAERSVAEWQDRGFQAYFEAIVVKREPAYRVKLWGYGTKTEAERDAARIRSKYAVKDVVVE